MNVYKNGHIKQVEPKRMTPEELRDDYQYERANRFIVSLFKAGLINEKEMKTAINLNKEKFSPFLKELL